MYSFSIRRRNEISAPPGPREQSQGESYWAVFPFLYWVCVQEAKMRSLWRGTSPSVFARADTIICDQPPLIGRGDVPLRQWKRHSLASEILVSMSFPPRVSSGLSAHPVWAPDTGAVFTGGIASLSTSTILHRSGLPLSSWTLWFPDWQTIYFMQKNQEHGWRDHTFWVCHLLWRKFFYLIR